MLCRSSRCFRFLGTVAGSIVFLTLLAPVANAQDDTDARAMASYRLTAPAVEKYLQVHRDLIRYARAHPDKVREFRQQEELRVDDDDDRSLDQSAAELDRVPFFRDALRANGVPPREYILTSFALLQAAMAFEFKQHGYIDQVPKDIPAAHIALYQRFRSELERLESEMKVVEQELRLDEEAVGETEQSVPPL